MSFPKMVFYDWAGGNEALFKTINSVGGEWFNLAAIMISRYTDPKYFAFFLVLMALCAALDFTLRKIRKRGGADHVIIGWCGAILVVLGAYVVDGALVEFCKRGFGMPRPYVVLAPEDIALLEYRADRTEDYRSFPSSHVSFVTVMLVGLWPVLTSGPQKLGIAGVVLVAWSRIAVGAHFPADVLYAFLMALLVTVPMRWFIYANLLRFFNLKC